MRAFGLGTHIASNNFKSVLLLAGFPVLLLLLMYALFLLYAGVAGDYGGAYAENGVASPFLWAANSLTHAWPFALGGAGAWFTVAYFSHQALIDMSTGARELTRKENGRVWNLLENLCISRGIPMPSLRVIDTPALNAFASGLHEKQYSITVTSGLLETLDDAELEGVLAHELTHIKNHDVRLLVIAVIFVGIFSFVGEMTFRGLTNMRWSGGGGRSRSSSSSSSRDSGGGAIIAIVAALVMIAIAYALAIAIRFALSRRREYLADAGAVELTKNPDAMISALRKISGHAEVPRAPAEVREMFIENTHVGIGEIFATHPPIEKRIAALVAFAGGLDLGAAPDGAPEFGKRKRGPWG
ncbi:MAG: M48 family metallopeptidase [Hyphomonadaceae bacterium]|nr:MAG: heat shock protein HtpX [Caulobacteraceae bacterium]MBT9445235.1 M48 family metallopeptidase [Hyphomonadaceae bacterium]TPW07296.1 MAG: heat shock protein HtpX [Alphaproteobacteria bacterium]